MKEVSINRENSRVQNEEINEYVNWNVITQKYLTIYAITPKNWADYALRANFELRHYAKKMANYATTPKKLANYAITPQYNPPPSGISGVIQGISSTKNYRTLTQNIFYLDI